MFESWDDNSGLFGVEVFVGGSEATRDSENEKMFHFFRLDFKGQ